MGPEGARGFADFAIALFAVVVQLFVIVQGGLCFAFPARGEVAGVGERGRTVEGERVKVGEYPGIGNTVQERAGKGKKR
jgi:hypothetical protein